jgi:biotin transporter BioY
MLRALATWSGAIAGLLLIVAGGLIPAAFPFADQGTLAMRPLGVTLQVPALLLTALVGGHRAGLLAAAAYLSIGLFQLPVFHGGGGTSYLLDPGFGFLAGVLPAAWITGYIACRSERRRHPAIRKAFEIAGIMAKLNNAPQRLSAPRPQPAPRTLVGDVRQ